MGPLQKALKQQIADIPIISLRNILDRKLNSDKTNIPSEAIDALARHILSQNKNVFTWNDGDLSTGQRNINLSFDDEDIKEIDDVVEKIPDIIKTIIQDVIEEGGKILYKQLQKDWISYREYEQFETEEFIDRLGGRWKEGIQNLRMLLVAAREMGDKTTKRHRRSKSKSHTHRIFVLVRLHMRACQVADEIITLLENGFADGAMARWRTLHEIDVVATIVEDADEDLAKRYIEHEIVDQKKQIDDWDEKMVPLGYKKVDQRTRKHVESRLNQVLVHYGSEFKNDYGWAAKRLGIKRPDFRALQRAADQSGMSVYYKLANYNVHVGSRSMFIRLTDLGSDIMIAGRSNAGLLEPGQNTAFTLTRITASVLGRVRELDGLIEMRVLTLMRDAAQKAFLRADRKLSRDDAAFRREQQSKSNARSERRRLEQNQKQKLPAR